MAWLRRVIPREGESNRSRWDTDPTGRVAQQASFTPTSPPIHWLIRRKQREHDVRTVDRGLLGLFKRREALLHADPCGRDLSLAMREAVAALERELVARGERFDEAVRRKRQDCGLPVPLPGKVRPLRPHNRRTGAADSAAVADLERALDAQRLVDLELAATLATAALEASGVGAGDQWRTWAWLRWKSAEVRLHEAYAALEVAELAGATFAELERRERAWEQTMASFSAACSLSQRGDGGRGRHGNPDRSNAAQAVVGNDGAARDKQRAGDVERGTGEMFGIGA